MSPGQRLDSSSARSPKDRAKPGETATEREPVRDRSFSQWGDLLSMGWNFACSIGVGLALGILFDKYLETRPWGTMSFLLLGIASGFVNLFRVARRLDQERDSKDEKRETSTQ